MTAPAGGVNGSVSKPVKGAENGQNRTNSSAICILSRSNHRQSINPPLPPAAGLPLVFRRFTTAQLHSLVPSFFSCCAVVSCLNLWRGDKKGNPFSPSRRVSQPHSHSRICASRDMALVSRPSKQKAMIPICSGDRQRFVI